MEEHTAANHIAPSPTPDPKRLDERLKRDSIGAPITIGNNVFIGANVTIL